MLIAPLFSCDFALCHLTPLRMCFWIPIVHAYFLEYCMYTGKVITKVEDVTKCEDAAQGMSVCSLLHPAYVFTSLLPQKPVSSTKAIGELLKSEVYKKKSPPEAPPFYHPTRSTQKEPYLRFKSTSSPKSKTTSPPLVRVRGMHFVLFHIIQLDTSWSTSYYLSGVEVASAKTQTTAKKPSGPVRAVFPNGIEFTKGKGCGQLVMTVQRRSSRSLKSVRMSQCKPFLPCV